MTRRILIATDFTSPAHSALARAANLAAEVGARLDVVHVVRPPRRSLVGSLSACLGRAPAAAAVDAARQRLADAVAVARKRGADAHGHLVTGPPVATLAATARRLEADLIVVGARGVLGLRDHMIGTTAERLIGRVSGDVLVVRGPAGAPYRKLLACVDTDPAAGHALRSALRLAPQAEAQVLHAYDPPLSSVLRSGRLAELAREHKFLERNRARQALVEFLHDMGVDLGGLKVALRIGDPRPVIERGVSQYAPDLISVGHRTSRFAQAFLGSVARHVLRIGFGDVLVSRHR